MLDDKHIKHNSVQKDMVGQSPVYLSMLNQLKKAAGCDIPVLLYGETGSGKEVAAHNLHKLSFRSNKPFIVADCTVLSESLFESKLFGHEKGAFTGSVREKKGPIEVANSGTLFLDEIGEISLSLQAKLLRLLENYTFRRVGGTESINANVRIVCATNRDLSQMVAEGSFRQDLYYRLAAFQILTPSLQDRREDIPLLIRDILAQIKVPMGYRLSITEETVEAICQLPLKGNIRELRNIIQYCAAVCNNFTIEIEDISLATKPLIKYFRRDTDRDLVMHDRRVSAGYPAEQNKGLNPLPQNGSPASSEQLPDGVVDTVQMRYLTELIQRYDGDKNKVAKHLGISQRTLYRRLSSMQEGVRKFIDSEN
jgi:DNA-binding NtrC family response regulator